MANRLYLLYDDRAIAYRGTPEETDKPLVIVTAQSDREARQDAISQDVPCACYSYRTGGDVLEDERWEWDYWPEGHGVTVGFSDQGGVDEG